MIKYVGHGVGSFLNVHEGPFGIGGGYNSQDPGLRENFFTSNGIDIHSQFTGTFFLSSKKNYQRRVLSFVIFVFMLFKQSQVIMKIMRLESDLKMLFVLKMSPLSIIFKTEDILVLRISL